MSSHRVAVSLIVAIDVAIAARIALLWERLPPLMASHFGTSGLPNGWMSRGQFLGFLAAVGGGMTLLFVTSRFWLRISPARYVNMPNRDYWLAPDRRAATVNRMSTWMAWFGVATSAFMAFVTELTVRANLAHSGLANRPLMFALGAYALIVVLSIARLYRECRIPVAGGG
jgi:uncharacterized membrane protein